MNKIQLEITLSMLEANRKVLKRERDTYRELCGELLEGIHNFYWNDCTKHSKSIEALIAKAEKLLGEKK